MTSKEIIHRLLFNALWQMREDAHEAKLAKTFHLADLFHNTPLTLVRAENESDYDELLEKIKRRASEKGILAWVENNLDQ